MSISMIERVARALCAADGKDPDRKPSINPPSRGGVSLDVVRPYWRNYVKPARAAIEAMREPTDEMVRSLYESHGRPWADNEAADVWTRMNYAALGVG